MNNIARTLVLDIRWIDLIKIKITQSINKKMHEIFGVDLELNFDLIVANFVYFWWSFRLSINISTDIEL